MADEMKSFDLRPLAPIILDFIRDAVVRFVHQHPDVEIRTVALEICSSCGDALTAHLSFDTTASGEVLVTELMKLRSVKTREKAESFLDHDDYGAYINNPADLAFPYFADLGFDNFPNICWEEELEEIIGIDGKIVWKPPTAHRYTDIERVIREFFCETLKDPAILGPLLQPLHRVAPFRFGVVTEDGPKQFWQANIK